MRCRDGDLKQDREGIQITLCFESFRPFLLDIIEFYFLQELLRFQVTEAMMFHNLFH